ncbi:MAG: hypothetical protein DHS20C16_36700 [Phycisphaerae bacterium]|nr:MAG: hypothetical protein DHS20C16_36700 [Phycisphaerae bacterium]
MAVRYTQRGGAGPTIEVSRATTQGDPGLAFPVIRVFGDREAA